MSELGYTPGYLGNIIFLCKIFDEDEYLMSIFDDDDESCIQKRKITLHVFEPEKTRSVSSV